MTDVELDERITDLEDRAGTTKQKIVSLINHLATYYHNAGLFYIF